MIGRQHRAIADGLSLDIGKGDVALWSGAAMFVLAAHLASVWYVQRMPVPEPAAAEAAPAIMMELAPMVVAPDAVESETAELVDSMAAEPVEEFTEMAEPVTEPAVEKAVEDEPLPEPVEVAETPAVEPIEEAEAEPVEPVEEITPELPEVALAIPEPRPVVEKPVEKPVRKQVVKKVERKPPPQVASTKSAMDALKAAAPKPKVAAAGSSMSPARWQSRVNAHLNRYKRYPKGGHGSGTAVIRFTINESGGVTSASLSGSSGDSAFDSAALDLVRRASPVPAPPPEIARSRMSLVVPIRYSR